MGLYFYKRGWLPASGCALALATVLKLTPLIAVIPFVLWKDWKWIRGYCLSLIGFFAAMLWINSPSVVFDFFFHVAPAMSRGVPHRENRSIASCLQMLYTSLHGGSLKALEQLHYPNYPMWVSLLGKLIPLGILASATLVVFLHRRPVGRWQQLEILSAFAMLSVVVSPVSWEHAFVIGYPMLVLLWHAALQRRISRLGVVLLTVCSLDLGAMLIANLVRLLKDTPAAAVASFAAPGIVVIAVFLALTAARPTQVHQTAA